MKQVTPRGDQDKSSMISDRISEIASAGLGMEAAKTGQEVWFK